VLKEKKKNSAPEYVDALMDWIQALLDNEKIFPSRTDVPFPKHFESVVKQVCVFWNDRFLFCHLLFSDLQEAVSSVRPHLLLSLSEDCVLGRRGEKKKTI
jgi:hypothetical protein